jgi:hypothetical protein
MLKAEVIQSFQQIQIDLHMDQLCFFTLAGHSLNQYIVYCNSVKRATFYEASLLRSDSFEVFRCHRARIETNSIIRLR